MSYTKKKTSYTALTKWIVIPFLILTYFGSFGEQNTSHDIHAHLNADAIDWTHNTSETVHASTQSLGTNAFEYLEIEEEDDRHYSTKKPSQSSSLRLGMNEKSSIASFPPKQKIKLFILFHSWRTFL